MNLSQGELQGAARALGNLTPWGRALAGVCFPWGGCGGQWQLPHSLHHCGGGLDEVTPPLGLTEGKRGTDCILRLFPRGTPCSNGKQVCERLGLLMQVVARHQRTLG